MDNKITAFANSSALQRKVRFVHMAMEYNNIIVRPLCMPMVETIEIKNLSEDEDLLLLSTQSDSPHIHTTSFQNATVPPLASSNISVMFLPRGLGAVDGMVRIETSFGAIPYMVYGAGMPSPYRLRPLIGAKIAHNSVYSIPITMYNPHSRVLHITEIFTSNTSLHLEPPADKSQATATPQKPWDIAPHDSRVVIFLTFASTYVGKQTGYVNIKTDRDALVVYVDITVVNDGVHHVPDDLVDFGTLVSLNSSVSAPLTLLNAGSTAVRVEKIFLRDEDPNMNITAITNIIPPRSVRCNSTCI